MSTDAIKNQVLKYVGALARLVSAEELGDLSHFRAAVLVVHAEWSGPSCASLACWRTVLAEFPLEKGWLLLVDSDDLTRDFQDNVLRQRIGGAGEAFWIRDGVIVHRMRGYAMRCAELLPPTRELLGYPTATNSA